MDKERAKFILRSFRPDGADVGDADFEAALTLATVDRELGEWLVKERAFDAEFAECLARVDIPEGLRTSVLLAMVQSGSGYPKVEKEDDQTMVQAFAGIKVPEGLRGKILESMERTKIIEIKPRPWMRLGFPVAAVAGMAMAFVFLLEAPEDKSLAINQDQRVTVDAVQAKFIGFHESPDYALEQKGTNQFALISYLKDKSLPCGDMKFPPGVEALPGLGCRELKVGEKRGSLICLKETDGDVHLIIFLRKDIEGELPSIENPSITQSGEWAKACWGNEKYAYSLMSKRDSNQIKLLF